MGLRIESKFNSVVLEVTTKELGYKELRPNQEAAITGRYVCESSYKIPLLLFASKSVR